jgi:hypothetical protein
MNKRAGSGGTNDMVILLAILFFFIMLSVVSPILLSLGTGSPESLPAQQSLINISNKSADYVPSGGIVGFGFGLAGGVTGALKALFTAVFWQFDWEPFWMVFLHWCVRIIAIFILYRLIRSGAG